MGFLEVGLGLSTTVLFFAFVITAICANGVNHEVETLKNTLEERNHLIEELNKKLKFFEKKHEEAVRCLLNLKEGAKS